MLASALGLNPGAGAPAFLWGWCAPLGAWRAGRAAVLGASAGPSWESPSPSWLSLPASCYPGPALWGSFT